MDVILSTTVKVTKHKLGPFEHAQSMSKWPVGSSYVGRITFYPTYLTYPFPIYLKVNLEESSTFLILMLSMHIDRLI